MIRPAPQAAIDLAKQFEGLELQAKPDPVGLWSIGYGHKITPTDPPEYRSAPITQGQAETILAGDMNIAATELCLELGGGLAASLTDGQYAALCDFVFNEGIGQFADSTLFKLVLKGDYANAALEFPRWTFATVNGQKVQLPGLVRRRAAEQALFQQ